MRAYARYARDCDQRDAHVHACQLCRDCWHEGKSRYETCIFYRRLSENITKSLDAYIGTIDDDHHLTHVLGNTPIDV